MVGRRSKRLPLTEQEGMLYASVVQGERVSQNEDSLTALHRHLPD